jgi:mono/diheme cytochrome c family protein
MDTRRLDFCCFCIPFVICIVASSSCSAIRTRGPRTQNAPNSVWGGVYTLAQADKGQAAYGKQCASCHGSAVEGNDDLCAPPLAGARFWRRWDGASVGELYDTIQTTMPEHRAGSLSGDEYAAIVSFVLKANQLPEGRQDLPAELSTLKRILLTSHNPKS